MKYVFAFLLLVCRCYGQYAVPPCIPDPEDSFGYNPFTLSASNPAEWPGGESTGHYYIDAGHASATDSNTYGYPDAPRITFPTTLSAGQTITFGGTNTYSGVKDFTVSGTSGNPCFIRDSGTTTIAGRWDFNASTHLILSDFSWDNSAGGRPVVESDSSYITVRGQTITGSGLTGGGASAAIVGDYVVWYDNTMSLMGNSEDGATATDIHCIKPYGGCYYVWIVANTHSTSQGDSVQVGDPTAPWDSADPRYIFIADNVFHDDRENAIDIKTAKDVIIVNNTMYGYETSASSNGEVVVIHDSCEDVWVANNIVYDGEFGISTTGCTNIHVVGNVVRDIYWGGSHSGSPFYDRGTAIFMQNSTVGYVENNTVQNYEKAGIEVTIGCATTSMTLRNNIFASRSNAGYWDVMFENSTDLSDATLDYNIYPGSPRFRDGNSDETDLATWQGSTADEANSAASGTPGFTNEGSDDFTLTSAATARDTGTIPGYAAAYFAAYGKPLAYDLNSVTRPDSLVWDIGAFEYDSGNPPVGGGNGNMNAGTLSVGTLTIGE